MHTTSPNQRTDHAAPASARTTVIRRYRAPAIIALVPPATPATWTAWQVVRRERGFHVSRATTSGDATEFLRNEVRQVKFFRKRACAQAACDKANGSAS